MAARPAPLQLNWLAFPGTSGADYIDYIVGDRGRHAAGRMPRTSARRSRSCHAATSPTTPARAQPAAARSRRLGPAQGGRCCAPSTSRTRSRQPVFERWCALLQRAARRRAVAAASGTPTCATRCWPRRRARGIAPDAAALRAAAAAGRTPAPPGLRRRLPRRLAVQRPHHRRRGAVGRRAGGHADRPDLRAARRRQPAAAASAWTNWSAPTRPLRRHRRRAGRATRHGAPRCASDCSPQRDTQPAVRRRALRARHRGALPRMWAARRAGLPPEHLPAERHATPICGHCRLSSGFSAERRLTCTSPGAVVPARRPEGRMSKLPEIHLCIVQPLGYVHSLGSARPGALLPLPVPPPRRERHDRRRTGCATTRSTSSSARTSASTPRSAERHACVFVNLEQLGEGGAAVSPEPTCELLRQLGGDRLRRRQRDAPTPPTRPTCRSCRCCTRPTSRRPKPIPLEERPIDLLFIGSMNERRRAWLDRIEACGLNVAMFDSALYGAERDAFILQAKAVVNAHFYESSRFEQARVSHCLSLGTPVISERAPRRSPHAAFEDSVLLAARARSSSTSSPTTSARRPSTRRRAPRCERFRSGRPDRGLCRPARLRRGLRRRAPRAPPDAARGSRRASTSAPARTTRPAG